jgi:hypothetical protein
MPLSIVFSIGIGLSIVRYGLRLLNGVVAILEHGALGSNPAENAIIWSINGGGMSFKALEKSTTVP